MGQAKRFQQILGIRFLVGGASCAIDEISAGGGLVVVPSAPGLRTLGRDVRYREALLGADFAIADSTLMVVMWNLLQHDSIPKLSGLKYFRHLVKYPPFREKNASFLVMPSQNAARRCRQWLGEIGISVNEDHIHVAPLYGAVIDDQDLLRKLEEQRPRHIVLGIGGGTQEPLGFYLKKNLSYSPAIHCIGAAIAFLSGDQTRITEWVDTLGLGWLQRILSNPRMYLPRYWEARHFASVMMRFRDRLPDEPIGRNGIAELPSRDGIAGV